MLQACLSRERGKSEVSIQSLPWDPTGWLSLPCSYEESESLFYCREETP